MNSANGGIYDCGAVNLTFQGLGTGSTAGIAMTYCSRGIFADNNFNNFGHQGLLIGSGTANFISRKLFAELCFIKRGACADNRCLAVRGYRSTMFMTTKPHALVVA